VSRYQKGKTNLDFTEARDSEWQWHQLGYMQVCTLLQTDNHTSTLALCFLQAICPYCHPTNSIKALKAVNLRLSSKLKSLYHVLNAQVLFAFVAAMATSIFCVVCSTSIHDATWHVFSSS